MFELDYMESYLLPVLIIFILVVVLGVGALARKGGQ
jgi:hypothetical protein